jgi:hypothetical protein
MNHKTTTIASGLLAAVLGIAAPLATAAVEADAGNKVEMKFNALDRENAAPTPFASTCPVTLVLTEDARQNKETIGVSIGGALLADGVGRWATDGLAQLKDYGYPVNEAPSATAPQGGVALKTTITRAYTWQIGLKIFSMVAVKAQFIDGNGVLQEKYYRAHGDKTNMWGAASEYVTTLNYGLNNMLPAIARDLQSLCKGQKVEAYTYSGPEQAPKK